MYTMDESTHYYMSDGAYGASAAESLHEVSDGDVNGYYQQQNINNDANIIYQRQRPLASSVTAGRQDRINTYDAYEQSDASGSMEFGRYSDKHALPDYDDSKVDSDGNGFYGQNTQQVEEQQYMASQTLDGVSARTRLDLNPKPIPNRVHYEARDHVVQYDEVQVSMEGSSRYNGELQHEISMKTVKVTEHVEQSMKRNLNATITLEATRESALINGSASNGATVSSIDLANDDISRLKRPALTIGFGGQLAVGNGKDVILMSFAGLDIAERTHGDVLKFEPCLGSPVATQDVAIEDYSSLLKSQGRRRQKISEEGELIGSSTLLWGALSNFVQTRGRRAEGLSASGPAHGTFERSLIDLLSSNEITEASTSPSVPQMPSSRPPIMSEAAALAGLELHLLSGDHESAIAHCVANNMWAHAFIISHHISASAYRRVVSEFTARSLPMGSPTYSIFQILAGRGVDVVKDERDLARNWKQILRSVLANRTPNDATILRALGDRLWVELKSITAAHVCYIAATNACLEAHDRVMLVGGDHISTARNALVYPESILRTEAFLFAQSLNPSLRSTQAFQQSLREFQPFRLVHAMWLADAGLMDLAKRWVEAIRFVEAEIENREDQMFIEQLDLFEARLLNVPLRINRPPPSRSRPFSARLEDDADVVDDPFASARKRSLTPPPMFDVSMLSPRLDDKPRDAAQTPKSKSAEVEEDEPPTELANPFSAAKKKPSAPKMLEINTPLKKVDRPTSSPSVHVPSQGPSAATPAPAAPSQGNALPQANVNAAAPPPPQPAPQAAAQTPPRPVTKSSGGGGTSSWFSMRDFRGWLTQKIIGIPKNATVAKTGEALKAYYDDDKKRWIFPGDPIDAGPVAGAGGPPVVVNANKAGDNNAGGGPPQQQQARPGGIVRNRYVVAS